MDYLKQKKKEKSVRKTAPIMLRDETPFSYVEAYKSLRTNIEFVTAASDVRSIIVTSSLPEEGKSTTAINLAITLAEGNYSVVLVECDLRKPVLNRYLKTGRVTEGLSSILTSNAPMEKCIRKLKDYNISVIYTAI